MAAENSNPLQQLQLAAGQLHRSISNAFGSHHSTRPRRALQQRVLSSKLPGAQAGVSGSNKARVAFRPPFAAIIPGDTVVEQVFTTGLNNFLGLYNTALVVRLVLTWFPEPPAFIVGPLSTLCDPYLNLFRGIIPPLGGTLDFSPILAFVLLSVFTNTAAALPCELGPAAAPDDRSAAAAAPRRRQLLDWLPMSKYQAAYQQRVAQTKQRQQQQQQGKGGSRA